MDNFQEYLYRQHAELYSGLDEEMANDYFVWENSLAPTDWKYYAEMYSCKCSRDIIDRIDKQVARITAPVD